MTNGVVIVHPDWGIFLGVAMGLAFWSNMDCAGQTCAPIIPDEAEARKFLEMRSHGPGPEAFRYHPVQAAEAWATIEELDAAGLSDLTWTLKAARMGPAQGSA